MQYNIPRQHGKGKNSIITGKAKGVVKMGNAERNTLAKVGGAPLVFGKDADRDAVAQALNDRLEAAIRSYPEQYLWMHRRWRDD